MNQIMSEKIGFEWEKWISLTLGLITALAVAFSVYYSKRTWEDQRWASRALMSMVSTTIIQFPFPEQLPNFDQQLLGETSDLTSINMQGKPDFEVLALEIIMKNNGKNPASSFNYSILIVPVLESGEFGPIIVDNTSTVNELVGEWSLRHYPFVWRAFKHHGPHYLIVRGEYDDDLLKEHFYGTWYYKWMGTLEAELMPELYLIREDEKQNLIDYVSSNHSQLGSNIKYGTW